MLLSSGRSVRCLRALLRPRFSSWRTRRSHWWRCLWFFQPRVRRRGGSHPCWRRGPRSSRGWGGSGSCGCAGLRARPRPRPDEPLHGGAGGARCGSGRGTYSLCASGRCSRLDPETAPVFFVGLHYMCIRLPFFGSVGGGCDAGCSPADGDGMCAGEATSLLQDRQVFCGNGFDEPYSVDGAVEGEAVCGHPGGVHGEDHGLAMTRADRGGRRHIG